mgnify:CR=1 FL=1
MEWIAYVVLGLSGVVGLWSLFGKVADVTPSTKDNEFFDKVNPYVESAIDLAEDVSKKDIDGDGTVGKG